MKAKICGIKDELILKYITSHSCPPEFIGFIINYPKSKRFIEFKNLKNLLNVNKKKSKYVAVLVSPTKKFLEKIKYLNFDYFQIYDLSPEKVLKIKKKYNKKIISSITIGNKNIVRLNKCFSNWCHISIKKYRGWTMKKNIWGVYKDEKFNMPFYQFIIEIYWKII